MKRVALGLTWPEGLEPALSASTLSPPWIWAKASAIWLRFEFSTQTNSTRFLAVMGLVGPLGRCCEVAVPGQAGRAIAAGGGSLRALRTAGFADGRGAAVDGARTAVV